MGWWCGVEIYSVQCAVHEGLSGGLHALSPRQVAFGNFEGGVTSLRPAPASQGHELTSPGSTGSGVELLPVQGRYSEGQRFADSCSLLEQVCGFLALLVIYNYWAIVGLT